MGTPTQVAERTSGQITQWLAAWSDGDRDALACLMPLVYDELHAIAARYMRGERPEHTLQTTALVHETFLQLIDQRRIDWQSRAHFYGVAATLMRRVLMRHLERRTTAKRGGDWHRTPFVDAEGWIHRQAEELLALDAALDALESVAPRQCRIVEMRFFAGFSVEETAEKLGISTATVKRDWRLSRAWLEREVAGVANSSEAESSEVP